MVQQRYVLAAVLFVTLGVTFALRMTFPLVLTQMVYIPNLDKNNDTNGPSGELICPSTLNIRSKNEIQMYTPRLIENGDDDRYEWSQQLQGLVLSSFHWGNIVSQIPGGILVQKYGGKLTFLTSTFLSSIVVTLIPLSVFYGDAGGLIVTQVLCGLLQGPLIPSISEFSAGWFPVEERGRTIAIVFMGINMGGILSSYLVGLAIHHSGRWDIVFYGLAVINALSGILFALLCYEDPQTHPFISEKEKEFLKSKTVKYLEAEKAKLPPTPWKAILTSTPVIALLVSSGFYMWAFTVVNANFPKYMNDVLHIPIEKSSVYSTIPRIINIFLSIFAGFTSDWMHVKRNISLTTVRKIFAGLSTIIPAIFVIAASYANCDEILAVVLLSIAISGQGFDAAGTVCTGFDLAPNYIGPVNAISFTISSCGALLAPYAVGLMTPHAYLSEWRLVFWLTFIFYMVKGIVFSVWGSAKVQPWNSPQKTIPNA